MTIDYTANDRLFGKNLTVYGESKMIEIKKSYVVEFTETQAKELYRLLLSAKHNEHITHDNELILVYRELEKIFDSGIR